MPKSKVKAPVPLDKPVMGLVSGKNFVTANAVENILSQAKKVVTQEPLSTERVGFGKVPKVWRCKHDPRLKALGFKNST